MSETTTPWDLHNHAYLYLKFQKTNRGEAAWEKKQAFKYGATDATWKQAISDVRLIIESREFNLILDFVQDLIGDDTSAERFEHVHPWDLSLTKGANEGCGILAGSIWYRMPCVTMHQGLEYMGAIAQKLEELYASTPKGNPPGEL